MKSSEINSFQILALAAVLPTYVFLLLRNTTAQYMSLSRILPFSITFLHALADCTLVRILSTTYSSFYIIAVAVQ